MTSINPTLHIVGAGAIGSLLAAGAQRQHLAYQRYPRTMANIPHYARWLDNSKVPLSMQTAQANVLAKNDVLVLPLKVYQLESALSYWRPYLVHSPALVLLHNGMGGWEIAQQILGPHYPLLLATTSHGAFKQIDDKGKAFITYSGQGGTQIGAPNKGNRLSPLLSDAINLLHNALPPVSTPDNIVHALWQKLSVNMVINPLTALNHIQNKHILDSQFSDVRRALCKEFVDVANACGLVFNETKVHEHVLAVAKATGENYSSMHQDVLHGRPTEIDAINGYIVEMAKKKGIHVPVNTLMVERIKALNL